MVRLSAFSAYARPEAHLVEHTGHGALVTVLGTALALFLFVHETTHFWALSTQTQMSVDLQRRHHLPIELEMSFPSMPCAALSLDVLDISGTSQSDINTDVRGMEVHKMRLDSSGKQIGRHTDEYKTPHSQQVVEDGMGGAMMNVNVPLAMKHLADMEAEADSHEGCHMIAKLKLNRVAGRVHISAHDNMVFQMLPQLLSGHHLPTLLNISHTIHHVSFGPFYPGQVNPLNGYTRILDTSFASFKYFLKVVPTEYYGRMGGPPTETHQYSVTEYEVPVSPGTHPSIELIYDLSPIVVTLNEKPPSILHYLTRMSAVVGGVFAITRMLDRHLHWMITALSR
mmetsp:Transcript_18189/g.31162  ORF Transcript_18189/g.31162 Transcript_18189/m.31162 type:complete len:340 (+) Transcript_18189:14-1033(+)